MEHFDVVVIGSGFGGAVAACRLSQAGFTVLLLERGRRYEANDFPALPDDDRLMPDLRRWVWSQDQGLWDIQDLGEIIAVQAAGYGGGSLIYANVHLRPPEGTFDATLMAGDAKIEIWPKKFQGERLEPYFDLAAHMLNVAPVSAHPGQPFAKTQRLDTVTESLNRTSLHPPLAINYEAKAATDTSEQQNACTGCGKCCTGCPERAKSSLDLNYLAVAERNGAKVRTQCEVTKITQVAAGAAPSWMVSYVNHLTASLETITVGSVFLCAGAVNSTRLLKQQTELLGPSQAVLDRVGLGYFPNADAAGMVYETHHECSPSSGPAITTGTVHWEDDRFFIIQDGGYAPELERLLGILRAPLWAGRNRTHAATPAPNRKADVPRKRTEFPGVALVSPLDALLDAAGGGALTDVSPKKLAESLPAFLGEVQLALLLPPVVEATIERAFKDWFARSFLSRILRYESAPIRLLVRVMRAGIDAISGGSLRLSGHALRSVLKGGDLNRDKYLQELLAYDGTGANRRMMLLAMGQDAAPGALVIDADSQQLVADLDLFHLFTGYTKQELLMKDVARGLGGELRLNPLWSFYGKPITVHSQGGCRMSADPSKGVTQPDGQVHGCPGLYVLDGSILCRSVGVNPSPTILAIAESNVLDFIRKKKGAAWPENDASKSAREYAQHVEGAKQWRARANTKRWQLRPTPAPLVALQSEPLGLKFREVFHGYCAPLDGGRPPRNEADHRLLEIKGRPACPFELDLQVSCADLNKFFEDMQHRLELSGRLKYTLPGAAAQTLSVTGSLELLVPRHKRYGLEGSLGALQREIAGSYTTKKGAPGGAEERVMYYHLKHTKSDLCLEGRKLVRQDPGLDAWRDTTALFTQLGTQLPPPKVDRDDDTDPLHFDDWLKASAAGVLHVDLTSFIYQELPSFEAAGGEKREQRLPRIEITGTSDAARIHWAIGKFAAFFFGTLQRVYSPAGRNAFDAIYKPLPNGVRHERPNVRV